MQNTFPYLERHTDIGTDNMYRCKVNADLFQNPNSTIQQAGRVSNKILRLFLHNFSKYETHYYY